MNSPEDTTVEFLFDELVGDDGDTATETLPPDAPLSSEEAASNEEADKFAAETRLTPEQRERKRLEGKPRVDHLSPGVMKINGATGQPVYLPLFDVGDRIIAERHASLLPGHPWLDTRVFVVLDIDDDTGVIHCFDDDLKNHAFIGFKHPHTKIFLHPKKGKPFKAPKPPTEISSTDNNKKQPGDEKESSGAVKKRGRKAGSKNRPKSVIAAEKEAKRASKPKRKKNRR